MDRTRERDILEGSIRAVAQHALDAYALVEELYAAGFPGDGPTVLAAKRLRMQLLITKGDLERELGWFLLHCQRCDRDVHWVPGVGPEPGHWAHAEPAPPEHDPILR